MSFAQPEGLKHTQKNQKYKEPHLNFVNWSLNYLHKNNQPLKYASFWRFTTVFGE